MSNVTVLLTNEPGEPFTKSDVWAFASYPDALGFANRHFDVDALRGDEWRAGSGWAELWQDGEAVAKIVTVGVGGERFASEQEEGKRAS